MRQTAGFAVVLTLALAATRLSMSPSTYSPGVDGPTSPPKRSKSAGTQITKRGYSGGCSAYDNDPDIGPFPRDDDKAAATGVINTFFAIDPSKTSTTKALLAKDDVSYVVALAPDPRHTNLGLMFDREMVAIQQAAQDEGFVYNSAWLPWEAEKQSFSFLGNEQEEAELDEQRESCPGVLLFRKAGQEDLYGQALVVLVVGEQPTGGLNEDQWSNAIKWLGDNASEQGKITEDIRTLRILGPTFSGSLVSLDRDLGKIYHASLKQFAPFRSKFPSVAVMSGSISGCAPIQWFKSRWGDRDDNSAEIMFRSVQENDDLAMYRFFGYLRDQGTSVQDTAILSEDETAYGAAPEEGKSDCDVRDPVDGRPVRLYYPRDISELRNAYQEQSIFAPNLPNGTEHAVHAILQARGVSDDEAATVSDSIHLYDAHSAPLAQEAVLYGVVSFLRTHHTRYLLLRCTNPEDYLFLTRFFHRADPEVRIVTPRSH